METTKKFPPCDMDGCNKDGIWQCICRRCESEGADYKERFHVCGDNMHAVEVGRKHDHIRERPVAWCAWTGYIEKPPARTMLPGSAFTATVCKADALPGALTNCEATLAICKELPTMQGTTVDHLPATFLRDAQAVREVLLHLPQGTRHQLLIMMLEDAKVMYRGR